MSEENWNYLILGVFLFTGLLLNEISPDPFLFGTSGITPVYITLIIYIPFSIYSFMMTIVKPMLELYLRWRYDNSYNHILSLDDESPCEDYLVGETLYLYLTDRDNIDKMYKYILILLAITIMAWIYK